MATRELTQLEIEQILVALTDPKLTDYWRIGKILLDAAGTRADMSEYAKQIWSRVKESQLRQLRRMARLWTVADARAAEKKGVSLRAALKLLFFDAKKRPDLRQELVRDYAEYSVSPLGVRAAFEKQKQACLRNLEPKARRKRIFEAIDTAARRIEGAIKILDGITPLVPKSLRQPLAELTSQLKPVATRVREQWQAVSAE